MICSNALCFCNHNWLWCRWLHVWCIWEEADCFCVQPLSICMLDHLCNCNLKVVSLCVIFITGILWCNCLQLCWWGWKYLGLCETSPHTSIATKIFTGIFIAETAHASVRRFLGPTQNMGASFGFLLSYATTAFLPWRMCKLMLGLLVALPAAFAILLCEETPHWLVKKGNMEEARLVGFCSLLINFLFPPN